MATVINNPEPERVVVDRTDNSGWAVAVIILIVVIAVGLWAYVQYNQVPSAETTGGGANINVTLPAGIQNPSPNQGTTGPAY